MERNFPVSPVRGRRLGLSALVFLLGMGLASCGDESGVSGVVQTSDTGTAGGTGGTPATVGVTASPTSVTVQGTSTITAAIQDSAGTAVSNGTIVTFTLNDSSLGTVSTQATTVSGTATATFTAASKPGTAVVTARSGSVSDTVSVGINAASTGSIAFDSSVPSVIGIKGSGQPETSLVTFSVKDVNGSNVVDGTSVTFEINGPKGGETISPTSASTVNGKATTTLQSGSVAGPVRIAATVTGTSIASSSTPISIGGGIAALDHFTLSRGTCNLAGLVYANQQTDFSVFLADRFGNFNVLEDSSVSFYTEAGAIDRSNVTDATGTTSVTFRTQNPGPVDVTAGNDNPEDGRATVIATTIGEECFVDQDGDGLFESGVDTFPAGCDIGEPFVDSDEDGTRDATELYVDANGDGGYDTANGVWDSNVVIWSASSVVFTGQPRISIAPAGYAIANGGAQAFVVTVKDVNGNAPVGGSTVKISATEGTLSGGGTLTVPVICSGSYSAGFVLTDADTDTNVEASTITVEVTWKVPGVSDLLITSVVSGTIE